MLVTYSILLCADGSDASARALREGFTVVRVGAVTVATVVETADPMLMAGSTGFAGGTMDAEEYEQHETRIHAEGTKIVEAARASLGVDGVSTVVLRGDAGPTICQYAEHQGFDVVVIGTRGHGGIKRAILGSVADHVVRNAPCPVVVATSPE
mgnify:CR=1 FL=1